MRKLISIVFIALFLLNVLGYYGLFMGLHYQNSRQVNKQLDSDNYDDSETIVIKMPITIPYARDSRDFERVTGEFEYNGEFYRLVKQRLTRDTLHIVCLKDPNSKSIHQALATYVKTFTDKSADNQQSSAKSATDIIKDYLYYTLSISKASFGWEYEILNRPGFTFLVSDYCTSIVHPPERA